MQEIITKFKSCFEEDNLQRETLAFKTEDGQELGRVAMRQLKRSEVLELKDKPIAECLLVAIESWDFKDKDGKSIELNLGNLQSLTSMKKVDGEYALGIFDSLVNVFNEMNFVSEPAEKNSERQ